MLSLKNKIKISSSIPSIHIPSIPSIPSSFKDSLKNPSFFKTDMVNSVKPVKPVKPKKPMSSFLTGIIFAFIFVGIIVTLFTVYTLNNPDALNFISNIKPDSVIFIGFMIIVGFIGLSIVLGILCYLLFDILGSTMFFLLLHICLLLICSPYFLIVLIWGTYKFLTKKSSDDKKFMIILSEIDDTKLVSLWKLLLLIYVIQSWLLESPPSVFYNKIMNRS